MSQGESVTLPQRVALGVSYQGSSYCGWQRQPAGTPSVQERLEWAVSKVAGHSVQTFCAGRTDAGVHAIGQVVHFDSPVYRAERAWIQGSNSHLPADIAVLWAKPVESHFHARFSALARQYRYWIDNSPTRPALWREYRVWIPQHLGVEKMQQAAQYLVGEHDFSSFRGTDCQSYSTCRRVLKIEVVRQQDNIFIDIQANAFLLHMVRNIVGVLAWVGRGKKPVAWVESVLQARDRRMAACTMPANGLYLTQVLYPEMFHIPRSREV